MSKEYKDRHLKPLREPYASGTIQSGLIKSETVWENLGIKVTHNYDPESSPPQLVSRVVEYE